MNYKIDNNIRILVIGDLMIDHYICGNCNRISPEAPVLIVDVEDEQYMLGGAGNVLKNLKSFNTQADIISIVGDDDRSSIIFRELEASGIAVSGIVKDGSRCTTMKSRVLSANHQLIRIDRENIQAIGKQQEDQLINIVQKVITNYDIVLLSDYNKGLLSPSLLSSIFSTCKRAGIKTVLDPKGHDFSKYRGVDIIKPNKKEASLATGIAIIDKESLTNACMKIKEVTECEDVVVTMSDEGMAFYSQNTLTTIPTKALGVVDVTGAGDTVLASLGVILASGNLLKDACEFANHAAAVVVTKVGSATATFEEIEQIFL